MSKRTDTDLPPAVVPAEIVAPREQFRQLLAQGDLAIMDEVKHYYTELQIDYKKRITEAEEFLGFVESAEGLGARLERIERFLGIKAV